jgi:hypothetical protein
MMNKLTQRTAKLACATVVACAVLWATYVLAGRVPDMSSPIRVTDSVFLADGGSAWIELTDATGKKIAVDVHGSLERNASDFRVYLQRWYPVFPVPVRVEPRSEAGRALLEIVERAGRDGSPDAAHALAPARVALTRGAH